MPDLLLDLHDRRGDPGRVVPAPALVIAAAFCTQTGQAFGKQLLAHVGPLGVVALRLGFAALILCLVHRPTLPRRPAVPLVVGLGVAIAGMNLIYPAMRYLPIGVASTIQLLGPLAVAVFDSRHRTDLVFVALAGGGVWLVRDPASGPLAWQGLLLAALSAASMATYLVLARRVGAVAGGGGPLAVAVAVAALVAMPAGLLDDGTALLRPEFLLAGVAVALLSAVLPYSLELAALRRLRAGLVGVLLSAEPVVAGLAGFVVLDERLSAQRWLGIACICLATAALTTRSLRRTRRVT